MHFVGKVKRANQQRLVQIWVEVWMLPQIVSPPLLDDHALVRHAIGPANIENGRLDLTNRHNFASIRITQPGKHVGDVLRRQSVPCQCPPYRCEAIAPPIDSLLTDPVAGTSSARVAEGRPSLPTHVSSAIHAGSHERAPGSVSTWNHI